MANSYTALGKLTSLIYKGSKKNHAIKFSGAVYLIVDAAKRLHIVGNYRATPKHFPELDFSKLRPSAKSGARPRGLSQAQAESYYKVLHWKKSHDNAFQAKITVPTSPLLSGELISVEYETIKGDDPVTIYYHDFHPERPKLMVDGAEKTLLIKGGSYRVNARGICEKDQ